MQFIGLLLSAAVFFSALSGNHLPDMQYFYANSYTEIMKNSASDNTTEYSSDETSDENTSETDQAISTAADAAENDQMISTTADTTDDDQAITTNTDTSEQDSGAALQLETSSAILMEATTGTIIFEKNSHNSMRPASITKIMTLILIFEALEKGQCSLTDLVTVSEHAASMGGSQVYLETGEQQTVEDLIKCISIASANDACVAMAEFIGGSEEAFVQKMNEKAKSLGMNDTNFVNSCGLEADGHLTSAYDIALMARELSQGHPEIFNYCQIWMDTITHHTSKGDSEFGLTNTNKLLRYYSYATGLKTGYTGQSKYCLAATATRDDVDLIAVVMAEQSPTIRNKEAIALLDYGFANCRIFQDPNQDPLENIPIKKGTEESVPISYESSFSYVLLDGSGTDAVTKSLDLPEEIPAPVKQGDIIGYAVYKKDGQDIGSVPILATEDIPPLTVRDCMKRNLLSFFKITVPEDAEY